MAQQLTLITQSKNKPDRRRDPLTVLPSELWELCLIQACEDEHMPQILQWTAVSYLWYESIISNSVLWSTIYVDDANYDLLAMIAVFLRLSAQSPLILKVSVPLSAEWEQICSMIAPHTHRIREIIIQPGKGLDEGSKQIISDGFFSLTLQSVIQTLEPTSLQTIDVVADRSVRLEPGWTPPLGLVSTGNWILPYDYLRWNACNIRQLTAHASEWMHIGTLLSTVPLEHLSVYSNPHEHTMDTPHVLEDPMDIALASLVTLQYHAQMYWGAARLFTAASRSLQYLDLQITIEELDEVGPAVETLSTLRSFVLMILASDSSFRALDRRAASLPVIIANWKSRICQSPDLLEQGDFKCQIRSIRHDLYAKEVWMGFHLIYPKLSSLFGGPSLTTATLRLLIDDEWDAPPIPDTLGNVALPALPEFIADSTVAEVMIVDTMKSIHCLRQSSPQSIHPPNYEINAIASNPGGVLQYHWGSSIPVLWRAPPDHSRTDWVGIYTDGANKLSVTNVSSLGHWVPVCDDEWDGDITRPPRKYMADDVAECGEIVFQNFTLPWETGEYELRYHTDGTYKMIAQVRRIQIYLDPPESLEFASVREWLLRIVTLALDSDPDLMPRSALPQPDLSTPELSPSTSPTLSPESPESSSLSNSLSSILESPDSAITNPEPPSSISHDDDFRFWTDEHGRPTMRQAKRISYAVEEAIGVWLAPESIMEYPNVTSLTRRILRMLWRQQNALAERSSSGDRTALSEAPTKRHLRANMVAGVSSKFSSFK